MNGFYDKKISDIRDKILFGDDTNVVHNDFLEIINELPSNSSILDIGTGNGYVLREIHKMFPGKYNLYGIDDSSDMLDKAKSFKHDEINYFLADNYAIPFENSSFSTITAKNVTNFSPSELARVLTNEGIFIFREYGQGKGLIEISNFFTKRLIKSYAPEKYLNSLKEVGFSDIIIKKYIIEKKYDLNQLLDTIQMFPFIKDFDSKDEAFIKNLFKKEKSIIITSDPFILTARINKK